MVVGIGQNAAVLQLPYDVQRRSCETVTKSPFTSTCLMSPWYTEIHQGPYSRKVLDLAEVLGLNPVLKLRLLSQLSFVFTKGDLAKSKLIK